MLFIATHSGNYFYEIKVEPIWKTIIKDNISDETHSSELLPWGSLVIHAGCLTVKFLNEAILTHSSIIDKFS